MLLACEANLDSFKSFKCRFTITKAQAVNLRAALAGDWSNPSKCEFSLIVDENRLKFESFAKYDLNALKGTKAKGGLSSLSIDFVKFTDVKEGEDGFSYSEDMQTLYVRDSTMGSDFKEAIPTTFWGAFAPAGRCAPSGHLRRTIAGVDSMLPGGMVEVDGRPAVRVDFLSGWGDTEMYLDPQRAYLPAKVVMWLKNGVINGVPLDGSRRVLMTTFFLKDAQEFARKRWFPTHVLAVMHGETEAAPVSLREFKVTEIEVDGTIRENDMAASVPAGTRVEWANHKAGQNFRLKQNEQLTPSDTARLAKMLGDRPSHPLMDTVVHPPKRSRGLWWVLGAALVCVVGVAFYLVRRRARG